MKRKEITVLVFVGVVAAIMSLVISNSLFSSDSKRTSKVPVVESINSTLPDLKNDSAYSSVFNEKALDATQPVQIGNSQNPDPFQ